MSPATNPIHCTTFFTTLRPHDSLPCWQRRGGHQHGRASYCEIKYSYMNDDCISGTMLHGRAPPLEREDRGGPAAAPSASPNWLRLCPSCSNKRARQADRLAAFGNKHPCIKPHCAQCGYANARRPRIAGVEAIGRACAPTERALRANINLSITSRNPSVAQCGAPTSLPRSTPALTSEPTHLRSLRCPLLPRSAARKGA